MIHASCGCPPTHSIYSELPFFPLFFSRLSMFPGPCFRFPQRCLLFVMKIPGLMKHLPHLLRHYTPAPALGQTALLRKTKPLSKAGCWFSWVHNVLLLFSTSGTVPFSALALALTISLTYQPCLQDYETWAALPCHFLLPIATLLSGPQYIHSCSFYSSLACVVSGFVRVGC